MEHQPPPQDVLAAIAKLAIAEGVAMCVECEAPIDDIIETAIVHCTCCGSIAMFHIPCLSLAAREELIRIQRQQTARWN